MSIQTIYKIVRFSAWALVVFTILEMFSGFFSSSNFVTSILGNSFTFKIHTVYAPLVFAVLVYAHSLAGFFILLLRHQKYNTPAVKITGSTIWTLIFIVFIVMFFGQFSTPTKVNPSPAPTQTTSQNIPLPTNQPAAKTYTAANVAKHNSANDCWMIIDSKVYDLTNYLTQHPGGEQTILQYCGQDGSVGFATKDVGRSHSSYANQLLAQFYIGDLSK